MRTRISETGEVTIYGRACRLIGFYVASTDAGTLVFRDGGASGEEVTGTITPAAGWHDLPIPFRENLHVTVGGTAIDVTFAYG